MVVVMSETETVPMLRAQSFEDSSETSSLPRRNSSVYRRNIGISMKVDPLQIKNHKTGLELLHTAVQIKDVKLIRECVENLDLYLDRENVLTIFAFLPKCKSPTPSKANFEPSAPPFVDNEDSLKDEQVVEVLLDKLRHNCLLIMDYNANYIVKHKDMLGLSYNDIDTILNRDTFCVSSESLVYNCVQKWGLEQCKKMTLSPHHIKEVLRKLCYVPRYGRMSKKEFTAKKIDGLPGPTRSAILEEKEWRLIKFYITEKSKGRSVEDFRDKTCKPRRIGTEIPFELSDRSRKHSSISRAEKPDNEMIIDDRRNCDKIIIGFLKCFTFFFD